MEYRLEYLVNCPVCGTEVDNNRCEVFDSPSDEEATQRARAFIADNTPVEIRGRALRFVPLRLLRVEQREEVTGIKLDY